MGRHQENPVRKYFEYNGLTKKSSCKVEGCNIVITGNHAGNMQRHIQSCHKQLYDTIYAARSSKQETSHPKCPNPNKKARVHN